MFLDIITKPVSVSYIVSYMLKRAVEIVRNLQLYFYFHFYKIVDLPAINAVQQMGCLLQFSSETHLVISLLCLSGASHFASLSHT